ECAPLPALLQRGMHRLALHLSPAFLSRLVEEGGRKVDGLGVLSRRPVQIPPVRQASFFASFKAPVARACWTDVLARRHSHGTAQLVPSRIPVRGEDRAHDDSHPSHQGKLLRPSRDPRAGCLLEPRDPSPSSGQTARSTTVPPPTPPRQALRGRQKPARSTTWTRLSRSAPWPQRTPLPPAAPTPTRPTPHRRC